ncbi:fimbrial assembly family protein [Synechococcus sp. RS9907]|uniref:PilN domain-containing protein n=1 Tax=Synechococcus sp. RS9907 TaxID=221350 RepID=UPI00165EAD14|nr:PilN domain-containing protein [Synechococcus sp. RS9907]QNI83636.1 fimbrial assembly family protein [Synechococcus sp. RS9907]
MTSRQNWPKADLLQQRRLELGLPLEPVPVLPLFSLVLKGGIAGVVLVMLALLTLLGLQHRQGLVQAEIDALNPVEKRVGDAKARLRAMTSRRSTLEQQTQSIAGQLVAVRSGSALLEQLRRVTPQGVRLVSVDANPSKLLIKGESQGRDAFERINALDLNLEALPDMLPHSTTVVKAVADKQGRIAFTLEAKLDPSMQPTPEHLRGLGAEGLARRLELLQDQGVLP